MTGPGVTMGKARLVFGLLAAAGLALSAAVHLSTFIGVDPVDRFPPVWLLHLGLFFVVIPAVNVAGRGKKARSPGGRSRLVSLAGAPAWMVRVVAALFAYAAVNFVIFLFLVRDGSPRRQPDGGYVLSDHGRVVRPISEEEFHRYQGYVARGFSGHWMLFYGGALLLLCSTRRGSSGTPAPCEDSLNRPPRENAPGR